METLAVQVAAAAAENLQSTAVLVEELVLVELQLGLEVATQEEMEPQVVLTILLV